MRRPLAVALVLLALLVAADRAAAAYAGRAVAERSGLAADVDVTGVPFLTQALGGRYERVEVAARDVVAGELVLARLDAVLTGVRVPLSDAVSGSVAAVPVERVEARVLVGYDQLSRDGLVVEAAGDRVRVTGTVEVLGRELSAAAVSRVEAAGGELLVVAERFEAGPLELGADLDLRVPLDLPYGLQVTGLQVTPQGVVVSSAADGVLLSP